MVYSYALYITFCCERLAYLIACLLLFQDNKELGAHRVSGQLDCATARLSCKKA